MQQQMKRRRRSSISISCQPQLPATSAPGWEVPLRLAARLERQQAARQGMGHQIDQEALVAAEGSLIEAAF